MQILLRVEFIRWWALISINATRAELPPRGKADRLFGYLAKLDLIAVTDFIFIDLGPAGEAISPAAWVMGEAHGKGELLYDSHAQAALVRTVQQKYYSLDD
jgi:hypothetical protein